MLHWRRDRTAFAISGGGARGAAQVGMLRALIERGITPDLIVGVSIGAWNGAWIAYRPHLDWVRQLEQVWRQVSRRTLDMVWGRAAQNSGPRWASIHRGWPPPSSWGRGASPCWTRAMRAGSKARWGR